MIGAGTGLLIGETSSVLVLVLVLVLNMLLLWHIIYMNAIPTQFVRDFSSKMKMWRAFPVRPRSHQTLKSRLSPGSPTRLSVDQQRPTIRRDNVLHCRGRLHRAIRLTVHENGTVPELDLIPCDVG